MSEMSNVYILILDTFKSGKKPPVKVEKSAVLISLVFCCSEKEIRLFGQDLPYPEACWPYSPVAWSLLSSLLTKLPATETAYAPAHCHSKGGLLASANQHLSSVPFAELKSRCLERAHCELWHGKKMDAFPKNRRSLQKTKVLAISQRATYALTLIGGLRNAINYFKIITRATWSLPKLTRLKTELQTSEMKPLHLAILIQAMCWTYQWNVKRVLWENARPLERLHLKKRFRDISPSRIHGNNQTHHTQGSAYCSNLIINKFTKMYWSKYLKSIKKGPFKMSHFLEYLKVSGESLKQKEGRQASDSAHGSLY